MLLRVLKRGETGVSVGVFERLRRRKRNDSRAVRRFTIFYEQYGNDGRRFVVYLRAKNGEIIAEETQKVGVRMIHLERTETTDMDGTGEFQFYCNGQKVYMRGTNWKPLSPYHSQIPQKMQKALNLLVESNCNMVRVWGGGIYEDHEFFDFCDEHGILVWQDFMLACEWPPEDDFFCQKMYEEAVFIIKKYRNHPSLAVW